MKITLLEMLAGMYQDEEGATLVEYMLLVVLLGVACILGMTFLGRTTNNRLNNVATVVQ
jgi:Flp pilus assembly pilin Flp